MIIGIGKIAVSKNYLLIITLLSIVVSCTLPPIPKPTEQTAIIKIQPQVTQILMAETLDRKSIDDGRYFQVTPGSHRLTLLFQYDASDTGGLFIDSSRISCIISFYSYFTADTLYYLQATPTTMGAEVFLDTVSNNRNKQPLSNTNISCSPY